MPESRDNGRMLPVVIKLVRTGSSVVTKDVVVVWIPAGVGMTGYFLLRSLRLCGESLFYCSSNNKMTNIAIWKKRWSGRQGCLF